MNTTGYRVEERDGKYLLFFVREDGSEFFYHAYQYRTTAAYDGIRGSQKAPTTDDGVRARRQAMRSI